jgi:hypothetical protein
MNKNISNKILFVSLYTGVYIFSYLYLAFYHHTFNLFVVNIHESGELNFPETLFYSSHFLAHIPVLVVLALLFAGSIRLFGGEKGMTEYSGLFLLVLMILFLLGSVVHSFLVHGKTDTLEYIFQRKQGHNIYGEGGSWKLHLVSTLTLIFLIPVYVFAVLQMLNVKTGWNKKGFVLTGAGLVLIPLFSWLCEGNFLPDLKFALTSNRYLAHSVRELVTFQVTYFPLFFMVFYNFGDWRFRLSVGKDKRIRWMVGTAFVLLVFLFVYQTVLPLTEGIGNLAQQPAFTKGEKLPLLYLITSHYFEHFLDTVFFVLLCGLLLTRTVMKFFNFTL